MPKKTWFQHDINASEKDGLSGLIDDGGFADYGRFWRLQELFYFVQLHKEGYSDTVTIRESALCQKLRSKPSGIGQVLARFKLHTGLVVSRYQLGNGYVYDITMPNSLIFITKRFPKTGHIDRDIENKNKRKKKSKNKSEKTDPVHMSSFEIWYEKYPKKEAKKEAINSWINIKPDSELLEKMLKALEWQKKSQKWIDGIIPMPSTYLNNERWDDQPPEDLDDGSINI